MENFLYEKRVRNYKEKSTCFRNRVIYDKNLLDLASNDYLGLAQNKNF